MRKYLISILVAGGAGGAVGWVYAETIGQSPGGARLWSILAFIILGAGASLIGVLISNSDSKDLQRAVIFAFVCGLFWRPVFDAGRVYIERLPDIKKEEKAEEASKALDSALIELSAVPAGNRVAAARAIAEAGQATTAMVDAASRIRDQELRTDYQQRTVQAVDAIARAQLPVEQKVNALADVGRLAAEKSQTDVAVEAMQKLDQAVAGSTDPRLLERRERILNQLQGLADTKNNPILKKKLDEMRRRQVGRPPG